MKRTVTATIEQEWEQRNNVVEIPNLKTSSVQLDPIFFFQMNPRWLNVEKYQTEKL